MTTGQKVKADLTSKILFVGGERCGKTNLINRLSGDVYLDEYTSTIGIDFKIPIIRVKNRENKQIVAKAQLWDTSGQERFQSITNAYYRGMKVIAICANVDDDKWQASVEKYVKKVGEHASENVHIVLIATKSDLSGPSGTLEAMEKYAKENNHAFFSTSAKNETNLHATLLPDLVRISLLKSDEEYQAYVQNPASFFKNPQSSASSSPVEQARTTPTKSLITAGVGLVLLLFSVLTFPPVNVIPNEIAAPILAATGALFLSFGIILLSVNKWLSNLWKEESRAKAWGFTIGAVILGAALVAAFVVSFGSLPLAPVFSNTFGGAKALGALVMKVALALSAVFLFIGLGICKGQCGESRNVKYQHLDTSSSAPSSMFNSSQLSLPNSLSAPSLVVSSRDTPQATTASAPSVM